MSRLQKTWKKLDNKPVKRNTYSVTIHFPGGETVIQQAQAIAPSYARDIVLGRIYDRHIYNWFVTEVKSSNSACNRPNVIVQKMNGIKKTTSYYKIEVVTNEQYNAAMNMYRAQEDRKAREQYYGG